MSRDRQMISRQVPTGFTLIELTIAIAIFVVFMVLALAGITHIMEIFQQTATVENNQQVALSMIEDIKREAQFSTQARIITGLPPVGSASSAVGLCIDRNGVGQAMFFLADDPTQSGSLPTDNNYATNQLNNFYGGAANVPAGAYTNGSRYFTVKHLYKADQCTPAAANISDPANAGHFSRVGGSSAQVTGSNVQFFSVTAINTIHDFGTTSFDVSLLVTQPGPPGVVINPSTSPGKQFDDSVMMQTTIYPSGLP